MPTVLNAANEIAVAGFQNGQLSFVQIPGLIEKAMEKMQSARISGLEDVFSLDAETRDFCRNLLK
jgi:1-deoxy-D-xylulose-5-phosphate reductoisomerase